MAQNSISQVTPIINENGLNFLEYQGEILFPSEEIGRHLGYKSPSKSINILFSRNQKELASYATGIKLMQVDGCLREVRAFTEEGVYILSMLANTPKARDFRAKLARLLRNIRERRVEQARELGYQQGRDEILALPSMKAERQAGYLAGMEEGIRIQRRQDGLAVTERALSYMRRGLSLNEAAKLCDCNRETLRLRLRRLRTALSAPAKPVQGNLLEASHA